jgi:hypothetical protein
MWLRCPKCKSSRVRRGYEKPPALLRLAGVHGLLCDNCNLSYRGFAIPGTVPTHTSRHDKNDRKKSERSRRAPATTEETHDKVKYARRSWPQEQHVTATDVASFAWYYVKLRARVVIGKHHTSHSLGIRYRWHNWQAWQRNRR